MIEDDWRLEATWPGEPENVGLARGFVVVTLRGKQLPDLVDEACRAASELASNAVRHGGGWFTVSLERRDGDLTVAVQPDGGKSVWARFSTGAS